MKMKPASPDKEIENAMNLAVRYLSFQPRTTLEMQRYLEKKSFPHPVIETVVERMCQNRFLDDIDYAKRYIESRSRTKPRSRFALGFELKKKGIPADTFDPLLEDYDDHELARKAIRIKLKSWKHLDDDRFGKKLMNHLRYRGFGFDVCRETLDFFLEERMANKERY